MCRMLRFAWTVSIGAAAMLVLAAASIAALPFGAATPGEQARATLYPNPLFPALAPWIYGNLAAADFNHDGFEDIVVVAGYNGVAVLLGAGDGTFAPATFYGTEFIHTPAHVRTDDFNGDGNVDLALTDCRGFDSVHVFLGNGDGTFGAPSHYGTGFGQFSFGIADLNGDGRADLAVPNYSDDDVEILLGHGDGTFQTWTRVPAAPYPDSIAIADMDADGRLDLLVTLAASAIGLLHGRGDGTFDPLVTLDPGFKASALSVADVDEDGRTDIVALVANEGTPAGPGFGVLRGNGDGTFGPAAMYGWQTRNVEGIQALSVHDVDDDGHIDVVMPAWVDQLYAGVAIAFGNGDGTFGPQEIQDRVGSASAVAFADFDEDGRTDIAAVHVDAGGATVLLNHGGRSFGVRPPAYAAGDSPNAALIADFDGDARPDVAVLDRNSGNVSILLGTGDGGLLPEHRFPVGGLPRPEAMAAADFDGDGRDDLAFGIQATGTVAVLRSVGDGTFEPPVSFPAGFGTVDILSADVNHDGDPDLVAANSEFSTLPSNAGTIAILFGAPGLAFGAPHKLILGTKPYHIAAADFDADGIIDLAALTSSPQQFSTLYVFLGRGDGNFNGGVVRTLGGSSRLAAGDLDGDGRSDLVMASSTVEWQRSRGDGTFDPPIVVADSYSGFGTFGRCDVADADADGFLDIVAVNSAIRVVPGNGDGTFDPPHAFLGGLGYAAALGDLDLEGSLDIVLPTLNDVLVLLNRHTPDADQDGVPDLRDNCPTIPNPDQDPEACRQSVENVAISNRTPAGHGSGLVSWRTTHEVTLRGFNVVILDDRGQRVQLNDTLVPCEACVTGEGRSYTFIVPKHKSGRDLFIEAVCTSDCGGPFGPAVRN